MRLLLLLLIPSTLLASRPTIDGTATDVGGFATVFTWTHTVSTSATMIIVTGTTFSTTTVSTVTIDASGATQVTLSPYKGSSDATVHGYYRNAAYTATGYTCEVTMASDQWGAFGSSAWAGTVGNPGSAVQASGTSSNPTVDVTANASEVVIDQIGYDIGGTPTVGAGQTLNYFTTYASGDGICASSYEGATGTVTMSWSAGSPSVWAQIGFTISGPTATMEQEGFRFGVDDDTESAHTWLETQDVNTTQPLSATILLRLLANTTGDAASIAYKLKMQKNGTGGYTDVAVGATTDVTPTPTSGDATESGSNSASSSWAVSVPNASTGDLLIFGISWDDATTTTDVTEPSGQNGETLSEVNATPATDASTETRSKVWYCKTTGAWTAGTIAFTPSASEQWTAAVILIPAGQFDATTPIGASATEGSAATNESAVLAGTFTAGSTDGGGRLAVWTSADADPQTVAANFSQVANTDRGAVSGGLFTRDATVTNSESIAAPTVSTITSDSWSSVSFVIRKASVTNEVYVNTSGNIAAGGEATTARLTAPATKTTADFTAGRRWDDENGTDAIDIVTDDYTELEWALYAQSPASGYYEFRLYGGDTVFDTYTVTPKWTIGTAGGGGAASRRRVLY